MLIFSHFFRTFSSLTFHCPGSRDVAILIVLFDTRHFGSHSILCCPLSWLDVVDGNSQSLATISALPALQMSLATVVTLAVLVLLLSTPPIFRGGFFSRHLSFISFPSSPYTNSRLDGAVRHSKNYLGASIFIIYILLALAFTFLIVRSLQIAHQRLPVPTKYAASFHRRLRLLVAIAFISFSTLSFNMLSFLIVSYQTWLREHDAHLHLTTLWQWTTTSTLFLDFAHDICATSAGYFWTQQALLATLLSSLYMGIEGE